MSKKSIKIISLGWGVQSWALAAMSALGKLPPIDLAIHADTGWEKSKTYAFARKWTPWLRQHGVLVLTVQSKQAGKLVNPHGGIAAPVFTAYEDGEKSGRLRRQCSRDWKIRPVRRLVRHLVRVQNKPILPGTVEQWLGITLDEESRARENDVQYIVNRWPFLEMSWTRGMVIQWLQDRGLGVPVSSSCLFCPYHTDEEWNYTKHNDKEDWKQAVHIDRAIRYKRPGYVCYLHRSRQPLEKVQFGPEQMKLV